MSPAVLAVAACLGFAAPFVGAASPPVVRRWVSGAMSIGVCCIAFAVGISVLATGHNIALSTDAVMPLTGMRIVLDPLGALFMASTSVVGLGAAVFALGYKGVCISTRTGAAAFPAFVTSLLMVPAAASVSTFFLLWETMALSSLVLVVSNQKRKASARLAGQWYAVMTQFGAATILAAMVMISAHGGGQTFAALRLQAHDMSSGAQAVVFLLALVGFGSKAGAVPLHVWLARAHPEAPSPVSALMSGAMVSLGIYGIIRVGYDILGGGPTWWWVAVFAMGAVSALFGALYSATSTDLKRLLAYSTTDNIGLMLMGLGTAGILATSGHYLLAEISVVAVLLHQVNHSMFKGSLFLSAGSIDAATGTTNLDRLGGLLKAMPVTGSIFVVSALAIAALPPLNGFVSEWLLLQGMLHGLPSSNTTTAVAMPIGVAVLALTSGLTATAFVKAVGIGFLGRPRTAEAQDAREVSRLMQCGAGLLALVCVVLGIAPFIVFPAVIRASGFALQGRTPHYLSAHLSGIELPFAQGLVAPGLIACALVGGVVVVVAARRWVERSGVRRAEAWACGRELQTARMEYTATSFSEPVQRVFDDILRPDLDIDVSHITESHYFVERIEYRSSLEDVFERRIYRPTIQAVMWWGARARAIQNGSIHRYLAVAFGTLLVVLVVVA